MKKYFRKIVGAICDVVLIIAFTLFISWPREPVENYSPIVQIT